MEHNGTIRMGVSLSLSCGDIEVRQSYIAAYTQMEAGTAVCGSLSRLAYNMAKAEMDKQLTDKARKS